jgi:hypothetical protein
MKSLHPYLQQILISQIQSVEKQFSQAQFYWGESEDAYIEYSTTTTNGQRMVLRLFFKPEFPEVCPALVVWNPIQLPDREDGCVNDHSMSTAYHTRDLWKDGRIQICHMQPANWDASISYLLPIVKGVLWCEAYATYMDRGGKIASYLLED